MCVCVCWEEGGGGLNGFKMGHASNINNKPG